MPSHLIRKGLKPKITACPATPKRDIKLPQLIQVETFAQPHKTNNFVIPAKAGIQYYQHLPGYRPSPA
jgi:hypothetical protein